MFTIEDLEKDSAAALERIDFDSPTWRAIERWLTAQDWLQLRSLASQTMDPVKTEQARARLFALRALRDLPTLAPKKPANPVSEEDPS